MCRPAAAKLPGHQGGKHFVGLQGVVILGDEGVVFVRPGGPRREIGADFVNQVRQIDGGVHVKSPLAEFDVDGRIAPKQTQNNFKI
jgi:hypothetical protein